MELICNIQKDQRETFEIPLPTCLANPLGGERYLGDREKTKSTLKDYLFLIATVLFTDFQNYLCLPFASTYS